MKSRLAYQGLLFFNSTLLYSLAVRCTGARELLFFSAFIAALSLTANLAVQLSAAQFRNAFWLLKITSMALLSWVCLRSGISPSVTSLVAGVLAIVLMHRDALVGSPSKLALAAVAVPISVAAILLLLVYLGMISHIGEVILLLLISPYLLTSVFNRPKDEIDEPFSHSEMPSHAAFLIISQLLPIGASFMMLNKVSYENDVGTLSNYILAERAVAIGGSLVYFYARVRSKMMFRLSASFAVLYLLLAALTALSPMLVGHIVGVMVAYFVAGLILSYGTIALGIKFPQGILITNAVAFVVVAAVVLTKIELQPIQLYAYYIFPQLLLMACLIPLKKSQI